MNVVLLNLGIDCTHAGLKSLTGTVGLEMVYSYFQTVSRGDLMGVPREVEQFYDVIRKALRNETGPSPQLATKRLFDATTASSVTKFVPQRVNQTKHADHMKLRAMSDVTSYNSKPALVLAMPPASHYGHSHSHANNTISTLSSSTTSSTAPNPPRQMGTLSMPTLPQLPQFLQLLHSPPAPRTSTYPMPAGTTRSDAHRNVQASAKQQQQAMTMPGGRMSSPSAASNGVRKPPVLPSSMHAFGHQTARPSHTSQPPPHSHAAPSYQPQPQQQSSQSSNSHGIRGQQGQGQGSVVSSTTQPLIESNPFFESEQDTNPFHDSHLDAPQWVVSEAKKQEYDQLFFSLPLRDGKASGGHIKVVMLRSKLDKQVLAKVWALSDMDKDGWMTDQEFAICLFLLEEVKEGKSLPDTLPEDYIPLRFREQVMQQQQLTPLQLQSQQLSDLRRRTPNATNLQQQQVLSTAAPVSGPNSQNVHGQQAAMHAVHAAQQQKRINDARRTAQQRQMEEVTRINNLGNMHGTHDDVLSLFTNNANDGDQDAVSLNAATMNSLMASFGGATQAAEVCGVNLRPNLIADQRHVAERLRAAWDNNELDSTRRPLQSPNRQLSN